MKKLLLLLLGRWRILWDLCPWCNSDAPELYKCPVCRYNTLSPPPKEIKEAWWILYSAKIKLAQPKEEIKRNPMPTYAAANKRIFSNTQPVTLSEPMDQLFKEYVLPGVIVYRNLHGCYPPHELKYLENQFPKPGGISTLVWTSMLVRLSNEIKKREETL